MPATSAAGTQEIIGVEIRRPHSSRVHRPADQYRYSESVAPDRRHAGRQIGSRRGTHLSNSQGLNGLSIKPKIFGAHAGAKIGAQRYGILPSLVFRPAVKFVSAEALRFALSAVWARSCSTMIIGLDRSVEIIVGKTLFMDGRLKR